MRVLTPVVLVAVLVTGCTARAAEPEYAALPALGANSVKEVETPIGNAVPGFPSDMRGGAYDDAYLIGPHSSLRLAWRATGPALTEDGARTLGPGLDVEPVKAATGQEVLVVAVDEGVRGGRWRQGDEGPPTAELVVAGHAKALTTLPLESSDTIVDVPEGSTLLVASVPKGAPVAVRLTDAGRTQTLDVRTGARGGDAVAVYYAPSAQDMAATAELTAGVATPVGRFPVALSFGFPPPMASTDPPDAVLEPFRPSMGWAADGRAWLVVPRPEATTPIVVGAPLYSLTIDDPAVFALRMPDGTVLPALPGSSTMAVSVAGMTPGGDGSDVFFDVPADFRNGVFVTSLGGAGITAGAGGEQWTGTWSPAPPPAEAPIAFT